MSRASTGEPEAAAAAPAPPPPEPFGSPAAIALPPPSPVATTPKPSGSPSSHRAAPPSATSSLPTSFGAVSLLSPEPSSVGGAPPPPALHPSAQQAAQQHGADRSANLSGSGSSGGGSPQLTPRASGYPDVLYRPCVRPELLDATAKGRSPLHLYCCQCDYRGPSACRARCGVTRALWGTLTLGLGLVCSGAAADIHHHCPSCGAHVATSKYL